MPDSRVSERTPLRILCQGERGSCAACCGLSNFADRSRAATHARLRRRTDAVRAAWPDTAELAAARDALLREETPQVLFAGVKVCPFAGWVEEPADDDDDDDGRVGCLLHPSRHPDGADLRDLAVYPRAVCAGHFCAPHDWLRPHEVDLAQTAHGLVYGRVVTDAGLVKAVARGLVERGNGPFDDVKVARAGDALAALWRALLDEWPYADPDPRRFGGFVCSGDNAVDRSLPSCVAGLDVDAARWERTVLDAIATRPLTATEADAALARLRGALDAVLAAAGRPG
ncbi:MAG: hypothetical protein FJ137_09380 [Deltaproteobacteria bacterium]|nr:hypothetical protein [Deltaproteobacteria bacterium]